MRVSIETYRNFEIFFDIESESFYTVSNEYDLEEKKPVCSLQKWIDDYIKENENFTSFWYIEQDMDMCYRSLN